MDDVARTLRALGARQRAGRRRGRAGRADRFASVHCPGSGSRKNRGRRHSEDAEAPHDGPTTADSTTGPRLDCASPVVRLCPSLRERLGELLGDLLRQAAATRPRPPRAQPMSSEKIRAEHLQRPAFVYVRQSSLTQVRHHHESRRRQYDLQDHARTLGWSQVIVIDEDLGKSGATAAGRPGFQRLVAEVSLGHAGAVVGLDVSRLARNNRDWYQLLDLCGLTNTLIIDGEGVYDPRQLNDRLLLGLKGTMSEAELGWIRQRAHEALLAKARRGALILGLPVGYVHTRDGRIEKHPDQRVQQAIDAGLRDSSPWPAVSARRCSGFARSSVTLPSLEREPAWGERVTWRLPVYNTVLKILTNPCYAGAYAFGRTYTRTAVIDGRPHKTPRPSAGARAMDRVAARPPRRPIFRGTSTSAIQQLIAHNAQMKGLMVRGAVRRGPSLLPGLLRCGHCGRRLHVSYSGIGGYVPRYSCRGAALNHGTDRCIAFGGLRVDEAIEPRDPPGPPARGDRGGAGGSPTPDRTRRRVSVRPSSWSSARRGTRRSARGGSTTPSSRSTGSSRRRWNGAGMRPSRGSTTSRSGSRALTADAAAPGRPRSRRAAPAGRGLPARVDRSPATDIRLKKRIVRLLIEEIVVSRSCPGSRHADRPHHPLEGGQAHAARDPAQSDRTASAVHRPRHRRRRARPRPCAVGRHIARVLNRLGYRTGAGNTWTSSAGARVCGATTGLRPSIDASIVRRCSRSRTPRRTLGVSADDRAPHDHAAVCCRRRSRCCMRRGRFGRRISSAKPCSAPSRRSKRVGALPRTQDDGTADARRINAHSEVGIMSLNRAALETGRPRAG